MVTRQFSYVLPEGTTQKEFGILSTSAADSYLHNSPVWIKTWRVEGSTLERFFVKIGTIQDSKDSIIRSLGELNYYNGNVQFTNLGQADWSPEIFDTNRFKFALCRFGFQRNDRKQLFKLSSEHHYKERFDLYPSARPYPKTGRGTNKDWGNVLGNGWHVIGYPYFYGKPASIHINSQALAHFTDNVLILPVNQSSSITQEVRNFFNERVQTQYSQCLTQLYSGRKARHLDGKKGNHYYGYVSFQNTFNKQQGYAGWEPVFDAIKVLGWNYATGKFGFFPEE